MGDLAREVGIRIGVCVLGTMASIFLALYWFAHAIAKRIQYHSLRSLVIGLSSEKRKALVKLLQYKYLIGGDVGAYELPRIEKIGSQIAADTLRPPLIEQCHALSIPAWRIRALT